MNNKYHLLILLCTFLFGSAAFAQTTRYVSLDGNDANNGSAWAASYRNLQTAINNSSDGEVIFVKKGNYLLTTSILMKEGVKIYGSFAGTETSLSQRDISDFANDSSKATILKSNGNQRVIINNFNESTKLTEASVLDGFVITGGRDSDQGAGIYNSYASPMLRNLIISENTVFGRSGYPAPNGRGGGLFNSNSSPTLINVTISGNTATGGSLSAGAGSSGGGQGGGIFNSNSSPTLINVFISGNTSNGGWNGYQGGLAWGGGVYNISSSPILINVTIAGNKAQGTGGNGGYGPGMTNHEGSAPKIYNTLLFGIDGTADIDAQYSYIEGLSDTTNGNVNATDFEISDIYTDYVNGDYSLNNTAPVVNSGSNTLYTNAGGNLSSDKDAMKNARVYSGTPTVDIIDMGASELQREAQTAPSPLNLKISGSFRTGQVLTASYEYTDVENDIESGSTFQWYIANNNSGSGKTAISEATSTTYTIAEADLNKYISFEVIPDDALSDVLEDPTKSNWVKVNAPIAMGANNTLYVKNNISGGNVTGDSWSNAIPDLADALEWAQQNKNESLWNASTPLQIWVAKGTYKPMYSPKDGSNYTNEDRENAFLLVKNVKLYGGFSGNEATLSDRGTGGAPTILSGDIGTASDSTDNAYHIVVSTSSVEQALIEGFVIKGGNANGSTGVTINGKTVYQNSGSGIYNYSSSPVFKNVLLTDNTANYGGGGVVNITSSATYINVTISTNTAALGGGMYNDLTSSPKLYNTLLLGNTATTNPGIYTNTANSTPDIQYSLIQGLSSTNNGNLDGTSISSTDIFTNPSNGDYSIKDKTDIVNAGSNSLYTNAGGNTTTDKDMAGNSRVYQSTIDMGAYESQTWVFPPPRITQIQPLNSVSGTSITLYGPAFDTPAGNNTVTFTPVGGGTGTTATVTAGTTTQLTVTVPAVAGGNYKISVKRSSDNSSETLATLFTVITGGGYFGDTGSSENVVSTSADNIQGVHAADVDGDGDIDLLSASENIDEIAWYENDGSESFTKRVVSTDAYYARDVYSADIDGDGDMDLMSASAVDQKIAWYKNDGAADPSFTEIVVSDSADGANSVFATDMDGDGDIDLMSASSEDDKIAWYENDGSENFTERIVSTNADGAFDVFAMDIDGDGDMDLLSASSEDDKIAWYENDGSQSFTERVVSTNANFAHTVFAADLDGDGDIDLMSASQSDDKIAWYKNDGSQNFTEVVVSTSGNSAISIYAADMDADGDLDIVSAFSADDKITWYKNDGATNPSFTEGIISNSADGALSVFVADIDNDGDLDVISGSSNDNKLAWYKNESLMNVSGRSIALSSYGDYVEVADTNALDLTNSFTVEGWVKTSFGVDARPFMSKEGSYFITLQSSDIALYINNLYTYKINHTLPPNTWMHIAIVFDANNDATFYLNGKNIGKVTGNIPAVVSTNPLLIGGKDNRDPINGNLDELRIWNEVRTEPEIQENMFQKLRGNEDNLVVYYPFDEQIGSIAYDASTPSYNAELKGGVTQSTVTHPYGTIITGSEGWRMMSAPVGNTSYGSLLDTLWTQGFTGADGTSGNPSVLTWSESSNSFTSISNATDVPAAGSGFLVYVYNDDNYDGTGDGFPKVIKTDSTQRSGSVSPSLSFTDSGSAVNDGWNFVGNPYGATIDWDISTGMTATNLDASFYVWSDLAGAYLSWNGATGTFGGGEIAPWQGFWVKANAASPALSLNDKIRSGGGVLRKKAPVSQLGFALTDGAMSSQTIMMFDERAEISKDGLDAYKLQSLNAEYLSLFTKLDDGSTLDINALPTSFMTSISIPLDFETHEMNGEYELSWNPSNLPDDVTLLLFNSETGKEIDLSEASSYSFKIESQAKVIQPRKLSGEESTAPRTQPIHGVFSPKVMKAKSSTSGSRFMIKINSGTSVSNEPLVDLPQTVELQQNYPNPFNPSTTIAFGVPGNGTITLEVFDVLGRKVATLINGESKTAGRYIINFDARNLSSGMYIYRLQAGNIVITKKLTLIK
tara:strand:- start:11883 stop:17900 length:6018 start_codon:yes stop_codon:yes gene_type:complete